MIQIKLYDCLNNEEGDSKKKLKILKTLESIYEIPTDGILCKNPTIDAFAKICFFEGKNNPNA